MKNKISLICILLMIAIAMMQISFAAPNLKVTFVNQDPDPVDANKNVEIKFQVENTGKDSAPNVEIELIPKYPFTLDSDVALRDLGSIDAYTMNSNAFTVKYTLRVDRNAADGDNKIQIRYRYSGGEWITQDQSISVNADVKDSYVAVTQVESVPQTLAPGESAKIFLTIKNVGDLQIKDLTTKIDLSAATLPIAPFTSITEKRITEMNINDEIVLEYDVMVAADAEPKMYKIPLSISFKDYDGNEYAQNDLISVVIGAEPELSYWIDTSNFIFKGQRNLVSVKFVNKGISDIKFLYITIGENSNYDIMSPKEAYLGNVNSDDYQTADFTLFIKPETSDTLSIPMTISYKDKNNKEYVKNDTLLVKVYAQGDTKTNGHSNNTGTIIFVVIILAVILFFVIRAFRKKKKN